MIKRMLLAVKRAHHTHSGTDYLTDVLSGPDTTFRSELIDAMSTQR